MKSFLLSLMLVGTAAVASPAMADEANPDAGKMTRILCYGVSEGGNPATREENFALVLEQIPDGRGDASTILPGNANYENESWTLPFPFRILVCRDGQAGLMSENPRAEAEALLATTPSLDFVGLGQRADNEYSFWLDNTGATGAINYLPDWQEVSVYNHYVESDYRYIYCEDPYGVDPSDG